MNKNIVTPFVKCTAFLYCCFSIYNEMHLLTRPMSSGPLDLFFVYRRFSAAHDWIAHCLRMVKEQKLERKITETPSIEVLDKMIDRYTTKA